MIMHFLLSHEALSVRQASFAFVMKNLGNLTLSARLYIGKFCIYACLRKQMDSLTGWPNLVFSP